jgi:hypothetical protein
MRLRGLRLIPIPWRGCSRNRLFPRRAFASTLSRLPEPLRQQLEASIGRTTAAMAAGEGGNDILKLMQKQLERRAGPGGAKREALFPRGASARAERSA